MYLLLLNITRLPVDLEIWVPMGAVNITVYLFLAAWGIVLLRNVIRIFRSDPIEIPSGAPPRVSRSPGPAGSLR